jgi:hypothetical protein
MFLLDVFNGCFLMNVFYGCFLMDVYKTTINITGGHHPVETWSVKIRQRFFRWILLDSTRFTRNISLGLLVHMLRAVKNKLFLFFGTHPGFKC